jgi:hypothetical protein
MRLQNRTPRTLLRSTQVVLAMLAACLTAAAQQPAPTKPASLPTMASMVEAQLGMVGRQFVAAAEAMPDDRYSFAEQNSAGLGPSRSRFGT